MHAENVNGFDKFWQRAHSPKRQVLRLNEGVEVENLSTKTGEYLGHSRSNSTEPINANSCAFGKMPWPNRRAPNLVGDRASSETPQATEQEKERELSRRLDMRLGAVRDLDSILKQKRNIEMVKTRGSSDDKLEIGQQLGIEIVGIEAMLTLYDEALGVSGYL